MPCAADPTASEAPNTTTHASPTVVATSSKRLPSTTSKWNTDIRPPASEIAATAIAATSEKRASAGCPTAKAHCRIVQLAAANASTADSVWTKSCRVKVAPHGRGQFAVQVTCESTRKKALATASEIEGGHQRRIRARERMRRPATAINAPPPPISRSTTSKTRAVGMPTAPNSLT